MTTPDGVRIETQAHADAVPEYSLKVAPDGWMYCLNPLRVGHTVTHLATPVPEAAAARAEALADAEALRESIAQLMEWAESADRLGSHADAAGLRDLADELGPPADRMEARERRRFSDVLADAYRAQQRPPTVMVELPRDVAQWASEELWTTDYRGHNLKAALCAALDAEGGAGVSGLTPKGESAVLESAHASSLGLAASHLALRRLLDRLRDRDDEVGAESDSEGGQE